MVWLVVLKLRVGSTAPTVTAVSTDLIWRIGGSTEWRPEPGRLPVSTCVSEVCRDSAEPGVRGLVAWSRRPPHGSVVGVVRSSKVSSARRRRIAVVVSDTAVASTDGFSPTLRQEESLDSELCSVRSATATGAEYHGRCVVSAGCCLVLDVRQVDARSNLHSPSMHAPRVSPVTTLQPQVDGSQVRPVIEHQIIEVSLRRNA